VEDLLMRVFVTGATGFVGSAIVKELLAAGHKVVGLTRSDAGARSLASAGAQVHRGSLEDLESLRRGAAEADGVIHTAFNHDFSKWQENCEADRRVIETLGSALEGSERLLIVTSGTALLQPGRVAVEKDQHMSGPGAHPRVASEQAAESVASRGVRVAIVRLPPTVHGEGDHGFVPLLIGIARDKGLAAYVGEGLNRWPAVHRFDAAALYRLALEKGTPGRYHSVAEEGVHFREIAEAIGRHLKVPVAAKSADEAAAHFGWFALFASGDLPASSRQTREQLKWRPSQHGLIADLDEGHYFKG
jgi:nucleoside-diphosphate-sugar epimerase